MILRSYQKLEMVDPVRQAFREKARRVLLTAPTGAGKTAVFSHIVAAAQAKGNGSWVMVHRDLLVRQASASLTAWGCPHGVLAAGSEHDGQPVQVVSIQTLSARLAKGWLPPILPGLLIADECHHAASPTWRRVFDTFADVPTLGVTATPCRLDGKGLGDVFDRLIVGPTPAELMAEGYLVRPQYWGVPQAQMPDLSGVGTIGGDFKRDELARAMEERPRLTGDVVAHYLRRAAGLKFCGFACNIKHATGLRDAFNAAGVACEVIHGKLSDDERADLVARLNSGIIMGLWSVDLISEGFDLPAVSCVILCRPTKSLVFHLQSIGRGLRPVAGKEKCTVLDHAGNLMREGLGAAESDREWSLEGVRKVKRDAETLHSVCQCPKCFRTFLRLPVCPNCGYELPVVERKIKAVAGTLKQLSAKEIEEAQRRMRGEQGQAKTLPELVKVGKARGMKDPWGWATRVFNARKAKDRRLNVASR